MATDLRATIEAVRHDGRNRDIRCPAHDDNRASLTVGPGDDGRVLLHCHAGCVTADVLTAAGMAWADLHERRNNNGSTNALIVAEYPYRDEQNIVLYHVVRFSPKGFRQRRSDGIWNMRGVRRVLYRLPELRGQAVAYVAEGEKDVDALRAIGLTATCNPGGTGKWRDDYTRQLIDAGVRSIVVLPDNDDPGRAHAEQVARACQDAGLQVKVVALPDLPAKGDVSDWLDAGHSRDELVAIAKAAPSYEPSTEAASAEQIPGEEAHHPHARESQASTIVRLVLESGAELWHTRAGDTYLTMSVNGHSEHHALMSRGTRDYLTHLYYLERRTAPNASALQDVIATLSGMARFDGDEHPAYVRVGSDSDRVYLDLCDQHWRAIEITPDGWQPVANPPVRFRRPRGVLPLPLPQRGGSIDDLRPFLNVATDEDFIMLAAWELAALRPCGPFPILIFIAEQGAAKTTTTRVLRRLIDPNDSDVRRPPRNTEDLMIAATNGHIVAFDNLSRLPGDLSDNLSVLATGGGFAVRQLYTNSEEMIFNAQRPIVLNGISQVATRGDLLDRAIVITLPTIPEHMRRDEATFWAQFDEAQPRILGALLDAIVVGLRRLPTINLPEKPRMADFALWGVATEASCPWQQGTFLRVYSSNRQGATDAMLDGDPVAEAARKIAPWEGTAAEFMAEVTKTTSDHITRRKDWFSRPRQVSDALRRLAPALRQTGIEVTFRRAGHDRTRLIHIACIASSASSAASARLHSQAQLADADADAPQTQTAHSSAPSSAQNTSVYAHPDVADAADAQKHGSASSVVGVSDESDCPICGRDICEDTIACLRKHSQLFADAEDVFGGFARVIVDDEGKVA